MTMTWRDGTTMISIIVVVVMIIAGLGGVIMDDPTSWRAATLLLIILGIGIYAIFGPRFLPIKEPWLTISTTLHLLAGVLSVLALIVGHKVGFMVFGFVLLGLWISATVYHLHLNNKSAAKGEISNDYATRHRHI